ncbi:MAG: xanthine dehydrogenase family protein molybdopterin-binding subunit [Actinobacteria bacterium]|nr:xanthine dehydrogenase family protein molybdopterin-binding subunit [Actinomycetota bacterium]
MSDPRILERAERRIEGRDKVTGRARYAADVRVEGALQVAFLRGPLPHARITSVDPARALAMPGVRAVITGADVRPARLGRRLQDWPVLAWDRVRFVGDRVAAVAAETVAQAEAAAAAIEVGYEELPAVFDPEAALAPDAPILHADAAAYRYLKGTREPVPHPNVQGVSRYEHGDVEAGFAAAAHVFEHAFDVARVFPGALEPRASVVWLAGDTINVVSTNKSPFALRDHMASGLDVPAERIVIDAGYIGGDFGGKGLSIDEYALTFLARITGRPVRTVTRYLDEMRATTTRNGGRIVLRTGVDASGRIVAHEGRVVLNGGAYAAGQPNVRLVPAEATMTLAGYRVPNARVEAMTVYTNVVPGGNARAPGQPQASFAGESHIDLIARALRIDPLELRLRNAIRPGDEDLRGHRWERSMMVPVIETLRREARWGTPLPPGRGRGMAIGARQSPGGVLSSSVLVGVTPGAEVEVVTSISDQGGGAHTMLQRIVAAELAVPIDRVVVRRGTTADTPPEAGVGGSRVTPVVGGAALAGARALRDRLAAIAPGLPLLEQIERAARGGGAQVRGTHQHAPGMHSTYAYAVEVEVDRETGEVHLRDCVLVADIGTVINPLALRGQLVGGFAQGLGQALMEEMRIEDGVVTNAGLGDYKMPTIADVPSVRVVLLTDDKGDGPFGAKSVGELTNPAVAPALANAIEDAVGVRVRSLPLTAEKVRAAIVARAG